MRDVLALAVKKSKPKKIKTGKKGSGAGVVEAASGQNSSRALRYGAASTYYSTMSKPKKSRPKFVRVNGRWVNPEQLTRTGGGRRKKSLGKWTVGKGFAQELKKVQKIQEAKHREDLKVGKAARGLGQLQFVEMGRGFGVLVASPAFVTKANYKGKTFRQLTSGTKLRDQDSLVLQVKTTSTAAVRQADALAQAIRGKNKQLATALNRAQGEDIRKVLAGASGIDVNS